MSERPDLPGWLWPLAALVIVGLAAEILFETAYQAKDRELKRLAQQTDDLRVKAQEGRAAQKELAKFHEEVRQLEDELLKVDRMVPQTADLAAGQEARWLQKTFETAGYTVRNLTVGDLEDGEFCISRRTTLNLTAPKSPEQIAELLQLLERRIPVHGLTSLAEKRHPGGASTYTLVLEVRAMK